MGLSSSASRLIEQLGLISAFISRVASSRKLIRQIFILASICSLLFAQESQASNQIVIRASGQLAAGVGPIMVVKLAGEILGTFEVRNTLPTDYVFRPAVVKPSAILEVVFTNDAWLNTEDRNLLVHSVTFNDVSLNRSAAAYDVGQGVKAFDNVDLRQMPGNFMPWNGALRFSLSAGLSAYQMGLVINDDDPYSVAIGAYYQAKHRIPAGNIVRVRMPVQPTLDRAQFASIKQKIDSILPKHVQAIALAWTYPHSVECNSITSSVTLGFDPLPCSATCNLGRRNPMAESKARLPYTNLGLRPSMLLAAESLNDGQKLIDRGLSSIGFQPFGSGYLMDTTDNVRDIRSIDLHRSNLGYRIHPNVNLKKTIGNSIQQNDILFYFQGLANVTNIGGANFYIPGAVADNLTSYGGVLQGGKGQTSILNFIAAGATGSYGTVSEPCAYLTKFSSPRLLIQNYTQGASLIEAYWKSVHYPFQGLFIGDPLAKPWDTHPFNDDLVTPAPVPFFAATGDSNSLRVTLNWGVALDNVGTTGYNIYRSSTYQNETYVGTVVTHYPTPLTFIDTNELSYLTDYTYSIQPFDRAGNHGSKIFVKTRIEFPTDPCPGCDVGPGI